MRTLLYHWIKTNRVMLVNAGSLVGTTAVASALGFVYWWLATRQFSPEAVGLASAVISAMTLLGTVCMLGLGTLLIGELPRQRGKEVSLISGALLLVGGVGVCSGIAFAIIAPNISADFHTFRASIQDIAFFAVGVSLTAISLVLDHAFIGLLRGELQFWRNTLFAVTKLAALFVAGLWLSHSVGLSIYATWVISNGLSLLALAAFAAFKGSWPGSISWPQWRLIRKLGPAALKHHLLNLTLQAPTLILPVLVTVLLSARMNAWFYVASMIAGSVLLVILALTTVLYATSAAQPDMLARKARLTLGLTTVCCVLANCVLLFGTKQVLGLFGHSYAEQSAWTLRILALGAFPAIIKNHYIAILRIQDRVAGALLPVVAGSFLEVGLATLGAHLDGLSGLSLGWVAAVCIESMFMFRTVYRAVRPKYSPTGIEQRQPYRPNTTAHT